MLSGPHSRSGCDGEYRNSSATPLSYTGSFILINRTEFPISTELPLLDFCILSNSTEHSTSWEDENRSVCHEYLCLLWYQKVHYRLHKSPLLDSLLSQINPVPSHTPYTYEIHFSIILPLTPRSPKWCLLFRFSDYNYICLSGLPYTNINRIQVLILTKR